MSFSSTPSKTPSKGRKDDDYTDYSCSTSVERLARDVETLLRDWHVDKGNDRHISMTRTSTNAASTSSAAGSAPKTVTTTTHNLSSASSVTSQMSSSTSATTQTSTSNNPSTLLLRSNVLVWNVSLTTPTGHLVSFTVELQLCLWDGPENNQDKEGSNSEMMETLPHSLRRSTQLHPMAPAVFENMSHLFGIGQHITLSPIHQTLTASSNASAASINSSGRNSLYDNMGPGQDLQFLAQSILCRHDDEITARWCLFQVLSGWLQTALNCAVANCHCCIPVFGIWGSYQPDLFHNSAVKRRRRRRRATVGTSEELLSVFPSWMNDIMQVELPGLPRMTRKHYMEIQDRQNNQFLSPILSAGVLPTVNIAGQFGCTVIPCAPHTPSRLTLWGNLLLQHCPNPNDTVVLWTARHVFAWWKQPMVKASAFQRLFQPDNYQYDSEHNPFTAWRRKPKQERTQKGAAAKKITIRSSPKHHQQQIIDLTEADDADEPHFVWGHQTGDADSAMLLHMRKMEAYQDQCRAMAITVLDQAAAATAAEPRWGPVDDPVASVHATVTWNGSPQPQGSHHQDSSSRSHPASDNIGTTTTTQRQPLLSFPLRIRSKHTMSAADWRDLEESVERTILDPLSKAPSCQFQVQAWWDLETPVASLAATQQCILAALVRTSTLPDETLLKHLTDDAVLEQWDNASGNVVAASLANQARVGPSTKAIVDAMDWVTSAEDKMSVRDAEILVMHILQPDNGSNFPQPPTSPLPHGQHGPTPTAPRRRRTSLIDTAHHESSSSHASSPISMSSGANSSVNLFAPLFKSAPLGRLVSILCVHLARVRSPCSMAMLWMAFIHEVRFRWENRMNLPHMNFVAGLDPSSVEMKERNRCLTTLGVKAEQSAYFVQPDTEFPGDHHCLIGQKLQVINLCIDMMTAVEAQRQQRQREHQEKRRTLEEMGVDNNSSRPNGNTKRRSSTGEDGDRSSITSKSITSKDEDGDMVMANGTDHFQDALSEDELLEPESAAAIVAAAKRSLDLNKPLNPKARKGARCPVPGSSLVANGDQLYAPYLQRPYPLTDDVIAERHLMLSRHHEPSRDNQSSVNKRLEISYRLQKPKLLSDMAAFKAANPGAIFQDFVNFYGNPGNPLDEYIDTRSNSITGASIGDLLIGRPSTDSVAVKLDKAAEAIQMLNETREFWSRTWEEATPIPASDQKLLFDATSTVEMALDFMENMHPAILVNQVLAVNLSASYFTLVNAAKQVGVLKIGLVKRAFLRLREKTEKALELLSGDATRSTSAVCNVSRKHEAASNFVSIPVISVCDEACTALSEAEVVTARATSLLNKFPEQYELVETFLRNSAGEELTLLGRQAQSQILQAISKQQMGKQSKTKVGSTSNAESGVLPAMREYVLRNLDDTRPCQLGVRFADDAAMLNRTGSRSTQPGSAAAARTGGGLLLALTKSLAE